MVNKKIVGVLGLASVALVGGTFAYFTQTATIDNPFDTARYSTLVTEDFVPEDGEKWQPGAEVNKDLYVQNTGDRDVVVRVKFEDFWYRGEELTDENVFITVTDGEEKGATKQPTADEKTFQIATEDGDTKDGENKDGTVVFKTFEDMENWTYCNGYYYYNNPVKPGESTGKFLDKVQLDPQLDLGKFNTVIYAKVAEKSKNPANELEIPEELTKHVDEYLVEKGWIQVDTVPGKTASITPIKLEKYNELANLYDIPAYTKEDLIKNNLGIFTGGLVRTDGDKQGYSDANYVLRITVQTVQATDKAVLQEFFGTSDETAVPAELADLYNGTWKLTPEALSEE